MDLNKTKQQIDEFCNSSIVPIIDNYNIKSKIDFGPILYNMQIAAVFIVVGLIVKIGFLSLLDKFAVFTGYILLVVGFIFVAIAMKDLFYGLSNKAKEKQMAYKKIKTNFFKFLSPEAEFKPYTYFPTDLYTKSLLFSSSYDRAKAEDQCSGNYNGTDFKFIEIKTEKKHETRDSKGNKSTYYKTIFKGILFEADFHKNFLGKTIVKADKFEKKLGYLARRAQRIKDVFRSDLKSIELENPDFENEFVVTATDPIEARYILSSTFMEKILNVKKHLRVELNLSFVDSKMYISIPYYTKFLDDSIDLKAPNLTVKRMLDEVKIILTIIDELELNDSLWKKEDAS